MDEEVLAAFALLDKQLLVFRGLASSHPLSQRRNAEIKYGEAYQALVRLGVRPQLRMKYRG